MDGQWLPRGSCNLQRRLQARVRELENLHRSGCERCGDGNGRIDHRHLEVAEASRSFFARALLAVLAAVSLPAAAYDWLQFNGDDAHSGNNAAELILSAGNVAQLTQKYQVNLPATADGAPVFLQGVSTTGGVKDLLFVTTTDGHIIALDAATGNQIWSHQYGPNGCIATNNQPCFTTSSPAIDPNRQYVYSYGLDGFAHKYQVGDGIEIATGGWPQLTTNKGQNEKGSAALATASPGGAAYLYVVHGGYPGDAGDYQGHVTAINLATGAQKVFNAACSNQTAHLALNDPACTSTRNAIWARPGVIYDAGTNRIFVGTGNGNYNGNTGGANWSESVLALNADGSGASGKPLDSYTPSNASSLDSGDADLGSTAPAILPVPATSNVQHLAVQAGKDALLRLIDLANLSGQGGPGHTSGEVQTAFAVPQGSGVVTQPAVWVNPADGGTWVFVGNGSGVSGLKLAIDANGNPSLPASTSPSRWSDTGHGSATSPIVANNVLYTFGSGTVRARDPSTGTVLWTSSSVGGTHWQSPIVANGVVYVNDNAAHLRAYALPNAAPAFTSAASAAFQVGVAGSLTVAASGAPAPTLSEAGALPSGVTFTATTGLLAGTPGPGTAGTYPLQFTASNGIAPDAVQAFTLTVNPASSGPAQLSISDAACTSYVLSGTPPNQTLTCVSGSSSTPVCAPTANPAAPNARQSTTISANCSNQPSPNAYVWTGRGCTAVTTASCTVTQSRSRTVTFSVRASNAAGQGAPAQITVTWK